MALHLRSIGQQHHGREQLLQHEHRHHLLQQQHHRCQQRLPDHLRHGGAGDHRGFGPGAVLPVPTHSAGRLKPYLRERSAGCLSELAEHRRRHQLQRLPRHLSGRRRLNALSRRRLRQRLYRHGDRQRKHILLQGHRRRPRRRDRGLERSLLRHYGHHAANDRLQSDSFAGGRRYADCERDR